MVTKEDDYYEVISMVGDYPIENQPNWIKSFKKLGSAIAAARKQHKALLTDENANVLYTVVQQPELDCQVSFLIYRDKTYRDVEAHMLAEMLADPKYDDPNADPLGDWHGRNK